MSVSGHGVASLPAAGTVGRIVRAYAPPFRPYGESGAPELLRALLLVDGLETLGAE
jgi:hypothetical protein